MDRPGELRLGLTLAELEQLNGKPFKLSGFDKSNVATLSNWNGGSPRLTCRRLQGRHQPARGDRRPRRLRSAPCLPTANLPLPTPHCARSTRRSVRFSSRTKMLYCWGFGPPVGAV